MPTARIPKTRLNQIAQRKLEALGVQSSLSPDGERLEGELHLSPGQLVNPLTGTALATARFVVEGHDQLRFLAPPLLADLAPQPFFDFGELSQVVDHLRLRIERRAAAARQLAARLDSLGITHRIDPERLRVEARLELAALGAVRLEGDESGLRAIALWLPGKPGPTAIDPFPIDLAEFGDRTDLELVLGELAERAKSGPAQAATPPQPAPAPPAVKLGGPWTLGRLVELFGPDGQVLPGAIFQRDLQVAGKPARFAARVDGPGQLIAKLMTTDSVIFSGALDPDTFPGVEDFVAGQFGVTDVQASARSSTPAPTIEVGHELGPGQPIPVIGEIWVMGALVEREEAAEIRYVGVDIDGQPFGAPRVLPSEVFHRIFHPVSAGVFRLPVEILAVASDQVQYVQLGPDRARRGEVRTSRLAPFLSSFTPEASSY